METYVFCNMGVSTVTGVPQNRWFIWETPTKMDDLEVPPFMETPICIRGRESRGQDCVPKLFEQGLLSGRSAKVSQNSMNNSTSRTCLRSDREEKKLGKWESLLV